MREYDRDTALSVAGQRRYLAQAPEEWAIHGNVNGGWSMAVAAAAAVRELPHGDPLVVSGSYVAPVAAGEVELQVETLGGGRSTSVAAVKLMQQGGLCCYFVVTATDLDRIRGDSYEERTAPSLPPFEQCEPMVDDAPGGVRDKIQLRFAPDQLFWWKQQEPLGRTGYDCWMQHRDESPIEAGDLLTFTDVVPPAVFSMLGPVGWVPTIELSVQVRARPVGNRLLARVRSRSLTTGFVEEDNELWDTQGRLVGMSRQLLKVRRAT